MNLLGVSMIGIQKQTAKYNTQAKSIDLKVAQIQAMKISQDIFYLIPALHRAGASAKELAAAFVTMTALNALCEISRREVKDGK